MTLIGQTLTNPVLSILPAMPVFALIILLLNACSSWDDPLRYPARKTPIPAALIRQQEVLLELQTALDYWRVSEKITGASMSVYTPTFGQFDLASGLAKRSIDSDRFPDEVLTIGHPMFAGDLTHTLVAALIIQLAENDELQLDSTIEIWFPNIENANRITVRNLLEHTSGIPVFYTDDFLDLIYEKHPTLTVHPDDVISVAAKEGSFFSPGSSYGYSKTNYLVLGRIVEMVTANDLETELQTRFFTPLEISDTYLGGRKAIPAGIPLGYEYTGEGTNAPTAIDGHVPQTPDIAAVSAEWASGGLVTTSRDVITIVRTIFESSNFSDISREMLLVADHPAQASETARVDSGAGVFTWIQNGQRVVGQFGFIYPFSAQFTYWPESKTVIAVIANEVDSSRNPDSNFQLPVIEDLTREAKLILDSQQ